MNAPCAKGANKTTLNYLIDLTNETTLYYYFM